MGERRLNNWPRWLQTFSVVLLILAAFAPLSDTLHTILALLASTGILVYFLADSPESRREITRLLIPLTALVLFALLVSIDPGPVILGAIGVYAGISLWEVFRLGRAEYLAERKRLP